MKKSFVFVALMLTVVYFATFFGGRVNSEFTTDGDLQKATTTSDPALENPVKQDRIEMRIAWGNDAAPHQFPYQVAVKASSLEIRSLCGGSLISSTYILTAAHCLKGYNKATILLGTLKYNDPTEGHIKRIVSNDNFIIHENYDDAGIANDIGLIRLDLEVAFNKYIRPIHLPRLKDVSNTYVGASAVATGWGDSATGSPDNLQYVNLTVITNRECGIWYGYVAPSSMCTSARKGLHRICKGDSGGPLAIPGNDDDWPTLIGVASFATANCAVSAPSGFTRVTYYLQWIRDNTDIVLMP